MNRPSDFGEKARALLGARHTPWLLIVTAVCIVYLQSTNFGFLDWDDPYMVTANDHVRHGITLAGLSWLPGGIIAHSWHPLTNLSWMIDAQLWGSWAGGFHLTNTLLHATASLLVWRIFLALGLPGWLALAGAMLFAVHPLRVEPVAWITGRKDLMVGVWCFAALLAYLRYRKGRSLGGFLLVTATVIGATLSKPLAIILTPMMMWIDMAAPALAAESFAARVRELLRRLPEKLPWVLITLAPALHMWTHHAEAGAVLTPFSGSLADRVAYPLLAIGEYLRLSFWPVGLKYLHPMWNDYRAANLLIAAAALGGITAIAWVLRRREPGVLLGWGWFLLALGPGSGIVRVGHHSIAERYAYVPHLGLILAVITLAYWLARKYPTQRPSLAFVSVAAVLALGSVAFSYASSWSDSMALRQRALAVTPDHLNASRWMAITLAKADPVAARAYAERIRTMTAAAPPAEIAYTLGEVYTAIGPPDEAAMWLARATALAPDQHAVWMTRAMFHLNERQFGEAAQLFRRVIELNPRFIHAWVGLGYALIYLNQPVEAEQALKRAIEINPAQEQAYFHLAVLSEKQGNARTAVAYYRETLAKNPWHAAANRRLKRLEGE